jgi:AraC family transcriptional regulator
LPAPARGLLLNAICLVRHDPDLSISEFSNRIESSRIKAGSTMGASPGPQGVAWEPAGMLPTANNPSFSNIQGLVSRVQQLGELTLTDTFYSPRLRLYPHAHRAACFGFVLAGGFSEQFPVQRLCYAGRAVFFRPPELVHENRVSPTGARCFYLEVSSRWLDHVEEYSPLPDRPISFESTRLQKVANCLYEQWQEMDDVAPLAIEGLACEMAAQFCRTARVSREPNPPRWLQGVHELLRCRFQQSLELAEIAREVGRHPVHVAREFHRYYKTTIGQFRRQCRIDYACERLTHSDLPIVEVALASGFAQQPHFTSVFRRITGLTPYQYRKLYNSKFVGRD